MLRVLAHQRRRHRHLTHNLPTMMLSPRFYFTPPELLELPGLQSGSMSFLPWPWERYTDQHGRPYYYNQAVRVSQWYPPQPQQPSTCNPTEIGRSAPPLHPLSPPASRFVLRLTSAIHVPSVSRVALLLSSTGITRTVRALSRTTCTGHRATDVKCQQRPVGRRPQRPISCSRPP